MDAGSFGADFPGQIDALRIVLSHVGQKFAVESGLLPSLCPSQVVIQFGQPVILRNPVHFLVGFQHLQHLVETGVDFIPVDFDELAEPDIVGGQVGIDFDGGDDRVDHIEDGRAVAVLGDGRGRCDAILSSGFGCLWLALSIARRRARTRCGVACSCLGPF